MTERRENIARALSRQTVRVNVNRPGEVPSWQTGRIHWDDAPLLADAAIAADGLRERVLATCRAAEDEQRREGRRRARELFAAMRRADEIAAPEEESA